MHTALSPCNVNQCADGASMGKWNIIHVYCREKLDAEL